MRHNAYWIIARTSAAGTTVSCSSSTPSHSRFCQAESSGRAEARVAACILHRIPLESLGMFLPRESVMNLST